MSAVGSTDDLVRLLRGLSMIADRACTRRCLEEMRFNLDHFPASTRPFLASSSSTSKAGWAFLGEANFGMW